MKCQTRQAPTRPHPPQASATRRRHIRDVRLLSWYRRCDFLVARLLKALRHIPSRGTLSRRLSLCAPPAPVPARRIAIIGTNGLRFRRAAPPQRRGSRPSSSGASRRRCAAVQLVVWVSALPSCPSRVVAPPSRRGWPGRCAPQLPVLFILFVVAAARAHVYSISISHVS